MNSPARDHRIGDLSFDPRLAMVVQALPRVSGIESIYVVGSVARATNTGTSDLDVAIVTKFPTYLGRFNRLMRLSRQNLDINLISTRLISKLVKGESSPFIPFIANYMSSHVLVYGKDTLPLSLPDMDKRSFAVFTFGRAMDMVWQIKADSQTIRFNDPERSKRLIQKRGRFMAKDELSVPHSWHDLGVRLEKVTEKMDPTDLCRLWSDALDERIPDLNFSQMDNARYFLINLLARRRFQLSGFFARPAIQERRFLALSLLFKSGAGNREKIYEAIPLIDTRPPPTGPNGLEVAWTRVQNALLEDVQTVMGLGEMRQ